MTDSKQKYRSFKSRTWQYSYRTSSISSDDKPVDILHDFYIPVLRLSARYDRVAGYFRSTSLAAASQGFSAFTGSDGKMRLIVGADLAREDVKAILDGDSKRMESLLNDELGEPEDWPENVTHGVELLCWMVARGHLDVKVAFRVHRETGKPLRFGDTEDGYVHEKWAIFTDHFGNRIYISGSLNESRTSLILNAENIDVHADWWSEIERKRADDAHATFEAMWEDRSPFLRIFTLPEAIRQKLIKIGESVKQPTEIDGSLAYVPEVEPPAPLERLQFALIKDGPLLPGGRFVGLETAPIEPWPHQEIVARRLIETWPYSHLLCDEVGLGKTIEAGLAIRSLYLTGLIKRVLIVPPANLAQQWQREMASKFFLSFARALPGTPVRHEYIFPLDETRKNETLYAPDLIIVSGGLFRRKERQKELLGSDPFDIALIDEAHCARRKNPTRGLRTHPKFVDVYRTIRDHLLKKCKSLWMATATPMQLDWIEAFDLIHLTNRAGPFHADPTLTWAYYEALGDLVRGHDIKEDAWNFLRRAIILLRRHDWLLWSYLKSAVIDGRIRRATSHWLEKGRIPKGIDRKNIQRLLFLAAPVSRVMLRHTRPLLEIYRDKGKLGANLPRRKILTIPKIIMTPLEKEAYDNLETYCKELSKRISANSDKKKLVTSLGFYLSFLRLRFASSLFAIRETIKRRMEKVNLTLHHLLDPARLDLDVDEMEVRIAEEEEEDDEKILQVLLKDRSVEDLSWEKEYLDNMLAGLQDISEKPSKMRELLKILDRRRISGGRLKQTVIFTRFYDTLQDIVSHLRFIDPSMLIGTYSGKGGQFVDPQTKQLRNISREEIKRKFLRGEIDILVCTDAAAEGLNLQTSDLLINYDLPWNPMKVEQRIGRIDRIGQKHEQVHVLNLCYVDSAEQIVYERLLKRLAQAFDVLGFQQFSLLPVHREEFNDLAAGELTPEELEKRAKKRMTIQYQRMQNMEIPAQDLYEIYIRLSQKQDKSPPPVTLTSVWKALTNSKYLRDLGCVVSGEENAKTILIQGIEGITGKVHLTTDRSLYERGLSDSTDILGFASYGNPFFDAVLEEFEKYPLPNCVARLTEPIPGTDAEVVAYAVKCVRGNGSSETRLVTSYDQLEDLEIDESAVVNESDLELLRDKLRDLVKEEFKSIRIAERQIKINRCAGIAQHIMNLLIARSLLESQGQDHDNFWDTIRKLDEICVERNKLMVTNLPVDILREIVNELLFEIDIPQVGGTTTETVPIALIRAALDAGCRIADSMKVKKSELTLGMVKARLDREIKKQRKVLKSQLN